MRNSIQKNLANYLSVFPDEAKDLNDLIHQVNDNTQNLIDRKNFNGHVTASGLVISDDNKVILIHHKILNRYLQPGGHIEKEDKNITDSAAREVIEETGLKNISLTSWHRKKPLLPILINSHYIPENKKKNEKGHFHHDFMFVYKTTNKNIILQEEEVTDFRWVDFDTVLNCNEPTLVKAIERYIKYTN